MLDTLKQKLYDRTKTYAVSQGKKQARKYLKALLLGFGGLAILAVIVIACLVNALNAPRLKHLAETKLSDLTGYTCVIEGDLEFGVIPYLKLQMPGLRMTGAEGRPFISVENCRARARLLPLIFKRLEFKDVSVSNVNAVLYHGDWGVAKIANLSLLYDMRKNTAFISSCRLNAATLTADVKGCYNFNGHILDLALSPQVMESSFLGALFNLKFIPLALKPGSGHILISGPIGKPEIKLAANTHGL